MLLAQEEMAYVKGSSSDWVKNYIMFLYVYIIKFIAVIWPIQTQYGKKKQDAHAVMLCLYMCACLYVPVCIYVDKYAYFSVIVGYAKIHMFIKNSPHTHLWYFLSL